MASGLGRSLYVGLKADTKNFGRNLKKAEGTLGKFKTAAQVAGAAVATSFAAMGAAAVLFGKNAVTAALEDQKGQRRLQKALENTTKATKAQRLAVENSISKYQMWYGVVDDKLRPAFQRLTQATHSITKSQKLMRLVLNISAGTGKDVEAVANAVSKAYGGNLASLQRLGLGLDQSIIKSKNVKAAFDILNRTFAGQGRAAAQSFQGSLDRLNIAFKEFQESVGYKILPYLGRMLKYIQNDLMPWLKQVKDGFTGAKNENISPKLRQIGRAMGFDPDKKTAAYTLGESLKTMADAFKKLFDQLSTQGPSGASMLDTLATSLTKISDAITGLVESVGKLKGVWDNLPGPIKFLINHTPNVVTVGKYLTTPKGKAVGGAVVRNRPYMVGENGPEMFVPSGSGSIRTARQTASMGGGTTVINLNGIVDADSARRSIENVLRNSAKRIGGIDLVGSTL